MTARHPAGTQDDDASPRKLDLNPLQVTAGALAAVTAAVLASGLGLAGTVLGAATASVVTSVGTAVYRASLERSRARVRALSQRTRVLPAVPADESLRGEPHPRALGGGRPAADPVPGAAGDPAADAAGGPLGDAAGGPDRGRAVWRRMRWGAVALGALGAFVLAMLLITGYESVTGETLGGHGSGTTLGRVVNADSGQSPVEQDEGPARQPVSPDVFSPAPEPAAPDRSDPPVPTGVYPPPYPELPESPGGADGGEREPDVGTTEQTPTEEPAPDLGKPLPEPVPSRLPGSGG